jgi:hypothetical protein
MSVCALVFLSDGVLEAGDERDLENKRGRGKPCIFSDTSIAGHAEGGRWGEREGESKCCMSVGFTVRH